MVEGELGHVAKRKERLLSSSSLQVCERSTSPRWDEGFHFLVRDPKEETLTVKVISGVSASLVFTQLKTLTGGFVSARSCPTAGARLWAP